MARQSADALATVTALRPRGPMRAPTDLTTEQIMIWDEVIKSVPDGHFVQADEPLLRTFVQVTEQLRRAQQRIGKMAVRKGKVSAWFAVFERASRMQTSLARALRITANARVDPTKVAQRMRTQPAAGEAKPWNGAPPAVD